MLGNLALARYHFVLEVTTPLRLSARAGVTLRGGFGHIFKRTVCLWPPGDCPRCLLRQTCSYPYIFETAPAPGSVKLRGLDQIPRPYVIEPDPESHGLYQPGERFGFRLVLVGRAIDYFPYFVFTFGELGRAGLGSGRGQFVVAEVHAEGLHGTRQIYSASSNSLDNANQKVEACELAAARTPPVSPRRCAVHFLTPTRIRNDGVLQSGLDFHDLIRALLRRLSSLCYFHCGCELPADFRGLIDRARGVRTVEAALQWQNQERFSGRQQQRIAISGVVGKVVFEAPDGETLEPFLPLLAVGEWVHVGKGCVMGLGKFQSEVQL